MSPKTVQRWCEEGRLETIRTVGGHRRVPESALRRFLAENGMTLPATLASQGADRSVVALVRPARAGQVIERLGAALSIQIVDCSYAAIVSTIAAPPKWLLVEAAAVSEVWDILRWLLQSRGVLVGATVVLVGGDPATWPGVDALHFPPTAMDEALDAILDALGKDVRRKTTTRRAPRRRPA